MKIIALSILISSCTPVSFMQKNRYSLKETEIIKSNGIYYTWINYYDPVKNFEKPLFSYLKFYQTGTVIEGINDSISLNKLNKTYFDSINNNHSKAFFSISNDTLYIEKFNGYNHKYIFEVFKINRNNTFKSIGSIKRKINQRLNNETNRLFLFKEF
jgi:hypothetical protein